LIRKDGVPSMSTYDSKFAIPNFPNTLTLIDHQPGPCVLYLGIAGGEELHNRRYFAGSPTSTIVGLWSTVTQHDLSTSYILSHNMNISLNITFNSSVSMVMQVPKGVTLWRPILSLLTSASETICNSYLQVQMFTSRPDNTDSLHAIYSLTSSRCSVATTSIVTFPIPYPRPGLWIVEVHWLPNASHSSADVRSSSRTSTQHWTSRMAVESNSAPFTAQAFTSSLQSPERQQHVVDASPAGVKAVLTVTTGALERCPLGSAALLSSSLSELLACNLTIVSMDVAESSSTHAVSFHSLYTPLNTVQKSTKTSLTSLALFSAPLHSPYRAYLTPGGAMQVTLRVHLVAGANVTQLVSKLAFTVSYRLGNLPLPLPLLASYNNAMLQLQPYAVQTLSAADAVVTKTKANNASQLVCTWMLYRPLLPGLQDDAFDALYLLAEASVAEELQMEVGLQLGFTACPPSACKHGSCVIQSGHLPVATCQCRYPWVGEQCALLAISYHFYLVQVLTLVLTNLSALPAVLCAYHLKLYLSSVGMAVSAVSSAIYHLCDTDALCVLDLSFASLQALDVLFSLVMIFIILTLYAPLTSRVHGAISILWLGALLAPVASNPTSTSNVLATLTASTGLLLIGHVALCVGRTGAAVRYMPGVDYTILPSKPEHDVEQSQVQYEVLDSISDGAGDVELVSSITSGADSATDSSQHMTCFASVYTTLRRLSYSLLGGVLGLGGLLCFALQGRVNYWYIHSLWHMLMMLSAWLLLKGRGSFFQVLGCTVPR
jgi:hypothetical protein